MRERGRERHALFADRPKPQTPNPNPNPVFMSLFQGFAEDDREITWRAGQVS